jgi:hypothetical protein
MLRKKTILPYQRDQMSLGGIALHEFENCPPNIVNEQQPSTSDHLPVVYWHGYGKVRGKTVTPERSLALIRPGLRATGNGIDKTPFQRHFSDTPRHAVG